MEESNKAVRINRETCVVCGACAAACPSEALVVEGLALIVVSGRCRPCGRAALVCPTGALTCPAAKK
ncbi:MAG: 4Fe-4S dicluster domain-containing protein [Candidatus Krumholzibacteriaceae bacterium]|jgi:Fe-S-cluster-containing hydrogenase component 2